MQVHKLLNIDEFREKYNIPEALFYRYQVAYDEKIYFIMTTKENNRTKYHYFRITFDWDEGKVLEVERFYFKDEGKWVYHWCLFHDYFLLVEPRIDAYKKVPNAHIADKDGNIVESIFIGDGVGECCTTPNGRIVAGYVDEGIFDEWNKVAKGGLTIWDENGRWIWKNRKYGIWYCYALTLDPCKRVWCYYYGSCKDDYSSHFHLVCYKKDGDLVFTPDIKGSDGVAVSKDYKRLLLGGGFRDKEAVYSYDMDCEKQVLFNKQKEKFILDGKGIEFYRYVLSRDKVFLHMEDGTIVTGTL